MWMTSLNTLLTDSLVNNWAGVNLPIVPRNGVIAVNPKRWAEWVRMIRDGDANARLVESTPSLPPPGILPMPVAGELHPWAMAGMISLNVQTGQGLLVRTADMPHLLELGAIMALVGPQGAQRQGATPSRTRVVGLPLTPGSLWCTWRCCERGRCVRQSVRL